MQHNCLERQKAAATELAHINFIGTLGVISCRRDPFGEMFWYMKCICNGPLYFSLTCKALNSPAISLSVSFWNTQTHWIQYQIISMDRFQSPNDNQASPSDIVITEIRRKARGEGMKIESWFIAATGIYILTLKELHWSFCPSSHRPGLGASGPGNGSLSNTEHSPLFSPIHRQNVYTCGGTEPCNGPCLPDGITFPDHAVTLNERPVLSVKEVESQPRKGPAFLCYLK